MFVGALKHGTSVSGYITGGLLAPFEIWNRHQELVDEMARRGMNHDSPLEVIGIPTCIGAGYVNVKANEAELHRRCSNCKF
jgi:hypothetical protein